MTYGRMKIFGQRGGEWDGKRQTHDECEGDKRQVGNNSYSILISFGSYEEHKGFIKCLKCD